MTKPDPEVSLTFLFLRHHPEFLPWIDLGPYTQSVQAEEIGEVHSIFFGDFKRRVAPLYGIKNPSFGPA